MGQMEKMRISAAALLFVFICSLGDRFSCDNGFRYLARKVLNGEPQKAHPIQMMRRWLRAMPKPSLVTPNRELPPRLADQERFQADRVRIITAGSYSSINPR